MWGDSQRRMAHEKEVARFLCGMVVTVEEESLDGVGGMAAQRWRWWHQEKGKLGSFIRMGGGVVRGEGGGGERERKVSENSIHLFRGLSHFPSYSGKFVVHKSFSIGQYSLPTPNAGRWEKYFLENVLQKHRHFPPYSSKFALDLQIIFH